MKTYILVGQNGIARLKKTTPANIIGLTTQIETCVAVAVIGKDEVTLLHADSGTDLSPLLDEIKLIAEPSKIIVVRKDIDSKNSPFANYDEAFNNCKEFLSEHKLDTRFKCQFATTKTCVVNITCQGVLTSNILFKDEMLMSPQKDLRDSIHWINIIVSHGRPAVLEFNGMDFLGLPEPSPLAALLLGRIDRNLRARGIKTNELKDILFEMERIFQSPSFCLYIDRSDMNQKSLEISANDAKNLLDHNIGSSEIAKIQAMTPGSGRVLMMNLFSSSLRSAPREIQHDAILRSFGLGSR